MPFFILFFSVLLPGALLAQENSVSFESPLRLSLRTENPSFYMGQGGEREGLYIVDHQKGYNIRARARFTLINDGEVHVDLGEEFVIRTFENGNVRTHSLRDFILKGPEEKIRHMMELQPGAVVTDRSVGMREMLKASQFISLMESQPMGLTRRIFDQVEQGLPLRFLEVDTISMNLDGESVLKTGSAELLLTTYWLKLIVNDDLTFGYNGLTQERLEALGDVFPEDDDFLRDYRNAVEELQSRLSLLERRGWSEGIYGIEANNFAIGSRYSFDSSNLVEFPSPQLCRQIF